MYYDHDCQLCMNGKDGPATLSNFLAQIDEELIYHDGPKRNTMLRISGRIHDAEKPEGAPLPTIHVPAEQFAGMGWVADKWGMKPIIYPVPSGERNLRTAIQVRSKPKTQDIYTHTGWTTIQGKPVYLSTSGGIGAKGLNTAITVALPNECSRYTLPKPIASKNAFQASMALGSLGKPEISVPMLLATYRAAIGGPDFAMHLAGRTGTFKSELCSLFQSHYGASMDARHLPASWSSTGNALEHLAYRTKDALIVLDDFVPQGTTWQVRGLQKTADQIIRAAGNQAGRARLTEMAGAQQTYYPRGLILSTGEDIPEGHSVRGRMLTMELAPGDIQPKELSTAQRARESYPQAMADWIQWLAETQPHELFTTTAKAERDKHLGIGHSRTPSIMGQLIATARLLTAYAADRKFIDKRAQEKWVNWFSEQVIQAGKGQDEYLSAADPVRGLLETIHAMLAAQHCHVRTRTGGIPENAENFGWTVQEIPGQVPTYRANGPRIAWLDHEAGELLLDPSAMAMIKKHSNGKLAVTGSTLVKRIKEAGILTRVDDARQRNYVRVTCEGHPRNAFAIDLREFNEVEPYA